jgi:hypothetical protein
VKDIIVTILVIIGTLGAWIQHCVTCIMDDRWGMLLAGGLFFPIGIVHGWLIWLGIA